MTTYCVYCHTTPSGKKYVGMSSNPVKRWAGGNGYKKNPVFAKAIEKYGWNSITHEILYSELDRCTAERVERQLIKEWNLTDERYGLNLVGGAGCVANGTRRRMSEARKGNSYCTGRKMSTETKRRISNSLHEYYKSHDGTFKGKHHTEETKQRLRQREISPTTRQKMRDNHRCLCGAHNPSARAIAQYDLNGNLIKKYEYAGLACAEVGVDLSAVIKCCRGKKKTCGGYRWEYDY